MKKFFRLITSLLVLFGSMSPMFLYNVVSAADTGFASPSATGNPDERTTGSNAYSNNGQFTNANNDDIDQGYRSFNLSVPNGATINGIEVQIEAREEGDICELQTRLSWNNGSNDTSYKTISPTQSDSLLTYGGVSDTWGRTRSSTDFTNGNFVLEMRMNDPDGDGSNGNGCDTNGSTRDDIFVDYIQVKVHYTVPTPVCGDGIVNGTDQCDDGNQTNTDACTNSCQNAVCGDGIVRAGVEACDDGNQNNADSCTNSCTIPAVANPPLGQSCGIDIALVADVSTSIDSNEMATMKAALTSFANAFDGTPTVFSLTQFGTVGTVLNNFSMSPAQAVTAIAGINQAGTQYTNWDDGLAKAYGTFDPRGDKPDLIVFASDGNPNKYDNPVQPGGSTQDAAGGLAAAIAQADIIKNAGVRIITVGIGNDLSVSNLEDISSPDAVYTSNFDTLAAELAALAEDLCGGTITVNKFINNLNTPAGAGWTFNVAGTSRVTDANGQTTPVEVTPGTYSVIETGLLSGHAFTSAVCVNQYGTGEGTPVAMGVSGIALGASDIIVCNVINTVAETCDGIDNDADQQVDEGFADTDQDGVKDCVDNCDVTANPNQADTDADGIGDVCEPVNGTCGTQNNNPIYDANNGGDALTAGSANLCANGTVGSFNFVNHQWTWTCNGSFGGSSAECSTVEQYCMDGNVDGQEACDDGNDVNNDTCNNQCQPTVPGICGAVNTQAIYDFNNGGDSLTSSSNGLCAIGAVVGFTFDGHTWSWSCDGTNGGNDAVCSATEQYCGDAATNGQEQCDDGNQDNADACKTNCTENVCGDGTVETGVEGCDDGNTTAGDGCNATCVVEYCGDGVVNMQEACDDGNTTSADGCNANCVVEFCGDGQPGPREMCDDGNTVNEDSCTNSCAFATCGDGYVHEGEQCDDGVNNNDDTPDACRTNCMMDACGDGTVDSDEACDDGNISNNDGCNSACEVEYCGDGTTQANEACDDGNDNDGDGCTSACIVEVCGDGVVNNNQSEACDDGNTTPGDGCNSSCQNEYCGDGIVNNGRSEACDDGGVDLDAENDTCSDECTTLQPKAKIVAWKIICEDESDLPNWGAGAEDINEATATNWVENSDGACWFAPNRSFQWGYNGGVTNPGDDLYGEAEGGWSTFGGTDSEGMTMVEVPLYEEIGSLWMREVNQEGYIPFTYGPAGNSNTNDVSAEIYCHNDVLNYDNFDRIDLDGSETYYCVAFNTLSDYCGDGEVNNDETCDDGELNGSAPGACNYSCTGEVPPYCGNGELNEGEQCDPAYEGEGQQPECRQDCTIPVCGDGIVDAEEQCDDGDDLNGNSCSNECTTNRGGGGSSCTVNCDGGDGDGDGDTPDELLETGGGEPEEKEPPLTSRPLVFGPQSPVALQLPLMLAATGATSEEVNRSMLWIMLIVFSMLGIGCLAMSNILENE